MAEKKVIFEPAPIATDGSPGRQKLAMSVDCDELLLGSVLGTGKTILLAMMALRYMHLPHYNVLILRRSWDELKKGLIKESTPYYESFGLKYHGTDYMWTKPDTNATISYGFLENIRDISRYRGIERQMIIYDELSEFDEELYATLNLWCRTTRKIPGTNTLYPCKTIASSNPGGKYGDWILDRWKWWLSKQLVPKNLNSGDILPIKYQVKDEKGILVDHIATRSCVVLRAEDNPYLDRNRYEAQFIGKPKHIIDQLKLGIWDSRPSDAEYFKRELITPVLFDHTGRYIAP